MSPIDGGERPLRVKIRLPQRVKRRSAFTESGRSPGAERAVGSRYERFREIPTPARDSNKDVST